MSKKSMEKISKNLHQKTITIVTIFFIIGLVLGFGAYKFATKDDCFKLLGEETITIDISQAEYQEYNDLRDEWVVAVAFGKDISHLVKVDYSKVNYTTPGEYYILYTVDSPVYENFTLYRTIIIVDPTIDGGGGE